MEDDLQCKMTSNGRWPPMEDDLCVAVDQVDSDMNILFVNQQEILKVIIIVRS